MLKSDSIPQQGATDGSEQFPLAPQPQHYHMRHPYQVLRQLPPDATPAQQDSAIQAALQPEDIHYSLQPDTLHLPGQTSGKSIRDVSVPQYYNESYFKNDSLYHTELNSNRLGIPGDPIPYRQSRDTFVSSVLLIFTLGTLFAFSCLRHIITVDIKEFFAPERDELSQKETSDEIILQYLLNLLLPVITGLLFFNYTQQYISETFTLPTEYHAIAIYCLESVLIISGTHFIYRWVDSTFFQDCNRQKWREARLLMRSLMAGCMMPLLLLNIYFNLSLIIVAILLAAIYATYVLLMFYKAYSIFFRKNIFRFQIFLYLCTLEVLPIAILWVTMNTTADIITIN